MQRLLRPRKVFNSHKRSSTITSKPGARSDSSCSSSSVAYGDQILRKVYSLVCSLKLPKGRQGGGEMARVRERGRGHFDRFLSAPITHEDCGSVRLSLKSRKKISKKCNSFLPLTRHGDTTSTSLGTEKTRTHATKTKLRRGTHYSRFGAAAPSRVCTHSCTALSNFNDWKSRARRLSDNLHTLRSYDFLRPDADTDAQRAGPHRRSGLSGALWAVVGSANWRGCSRSCGACSPSLQ